MPSRMLSNSARRNANSTRTPSALAISSAIGAEIGAANNIAASGPSISLMAGSCATMVSTNRKKAVLTGKASVVAIHPPHRKAAAKSHGVSRSRRSRYQSTASGTAASKLDSTSAWRNTVMTSALMPPIRPRWTIVAKASTTIAPALVTRHTPRRRSGEPINKRSLRAYETKAAIPPRKLVSAADPVGPPDDTRIIDGGGRRALRSLYLQNRTLELSTPVHVFFAYRSAPYDNELCQSPYSGFCFWCVGKSGCSNCDGQRRRWAWAWAWWCPWRRWQTLRRRQTLWWCGACSRIARLSRKIITNWPSPRRESERRSHWQNERWRESRSAQGVSQ